MEDSANRNWWCNVHDESWCQYYDLGIYSGSKDEGTKEQLFTYLIYPCLLEIAKAVVPYGSTWHVKLHCTQDELRSELAAYVASKGHKINPEHTYTKSAFPLIYAYMRRYLVRAWCQANRNPLDKHTISLEEMVRQTDDGDFTIDSILGAVTQDTEKDTSISRFKSLLLKWYESNQSFEWLYDLHVHAPRRQAMSEIMYPLVQAIVEHCEVSYMPNLLLRDKTLAALNPSYRELRFAYGLLTQINKQLYECFVLFGDVPSHLPIDSTMITRPNPDNVGELPFRWQANKERGDYGIWFHKEKWNVKIRHLNRSLYLGCFDSKEEAKQVRDDFMADFGLQ